MDAEAPAGPRRSWLRDNLVLAAAILLPAIVALLFVAATAVPRWLVPPPQHDLVFRAEAPYTAPPPAVLVDYALRDGEVVATFRHAPRPNAAGVFPGAYPQHWMLLRFDHETMEVRDISVHERPGDLAADETRVVAVAELAGLRVVPGERAPDGYTVGGGARRGSGGIVGELFGMSSRYRRGLTLSRDGRAIDASLPPSVRDSYGGVYPLGWVVDDGSR